MTEPTRDQELLARAIRASGLTPRQYAKRVLIRDPRMVRRWLAGQYQLPKEVRAHLEQLEKQQSEKSIWIMGLTREQYEKVLAEHKQGSRIESEGRLEKEPTRAEDRLGEEAD